MACTSFLLLVWALLAVNLCVPLVSGRSVANKFQGESELLDKRQWRGGITGPPSGGGNIFGGYQFKNAGIKGSLGFDAKGQYTGAGLEGTFRNNNFNLAGKLNLNPNGQLGANLQAVKTWDNGRHSLGGNFGFQPGLGVNAGLTYKWTFGKK